MKDDDQAETNKLRLQLAHQVRIAMENIWALFFRMTSVLNNLFLKFIHVLGICHMYRNAMSLQKLERMLANQ